MLRQNLKRIQNLRRIQRQSLNEKKREEKKLYKTGSNFPVDASKHAKLFPTKKFPFLL